MNTTPNPGFFKAIADKQSYLNISYLLLTFPLGLFYFILLVTGLSLGFGLFITLAGIPLLLLVLSCSGILSKGERFLAAKLLNVDIPVPEERTTVKGLWPKVKSLLSDRLTWLGTLYLLLKFPIGVAAFTLTITLMTVSIAFAFAPAYMWTSDPLIWGDHILNPYPFAWILSLVGIPLLFISVNVLNNTAAVIGQMTKAMLGKAQ